MKILILNYEYPPLGGGAGVITKHITEELARLGHNITVVTTWFPELKEIETFENLTIIRLKSKRKFTYRSDVFEMLSWMKYSKRFLKHYLSENSFDLCFANFAIPGGFVASFLKNKFRLPYTIISHGHDIPWFCIKEMFWYHLLLFPIIKKICQKSELNFIQTPDMKKNIDKFLGIKNKKKNIIIPNGCDTGIFYPDDIKSSSGFKIIFSGRLVKQKDPFTFLKALKILSEKNIPFKANIFGDGILRGDMEKYIVENKLTDFVNFSGWITKQQLAEEYRTSHVFVQSSIHEGMSIAMMEALASGTYILSTAVGINKDLIIPGETGEILAFSEPESLAEKLEAFYRDKFLTGFKVDSENIEKFRSEYDWKSVVSKYDKFFKSIINLK